MSGERGMYGRKDYPSAWTPGPLRRVAGEGQATRPSEARTASLTTTDVVEWEPQPVRYHGTIEGQAVVEWFDDSDQS